MKRPRSDREFVIAYVPAKPNGQSYKQRVVAQRRLHRGNETWECASLRRDARR